MNTSQEHHTQSNLNSVKMSDMCLIVCGSSLENYLATDRLTKNTDYIYCFFPFIFFLLLPHFLLWHYSLSASFLCHHYFPSSFLHQSTFLSSEHPVISCPNEWRRVWLLLLFSLLLSTVLRALHRKTGCLWKVKKVGGKWPGKTQRGVHDHFSSLDLWDPTQWQVD